VKRVSDVLTIEVEHHSRILLTMLRNTLDDEPPDVVDLDQYNGADHLGLACYRRQKWEQLRDALSLALGYELVRQALEVTDDDA
jgi:hypothetical protein